MERTPADSLPMAEIRSTVESQPPVIRIEHRPPARGDLLATTTFWLALVGILTIACGWMLLPGGTHGSEAKLRAQGIISVGSLFAMLSVACSVPLLYRVDRSTRFAKLAVGLSIVGFLLILLTPAF